MLKRRGLAGLIIDVLIDLAVPVKTWHTHREALRSITTLWAHLTSDLGKMARDILFMTQTEVGELREGKIPGKGTSSSMPHKDNPVLAINIVNVAGLIPGLLTQLESSRLQEHERATSGWHMESKCTPELMRLADRALELSEPLIRQLEVNTERMEENCRLTGGLIFAEDLVAQLSGKVGKTQAVEWVRDACARSRQSGHDLRSVLETDPELKHQFERDEMDHIFNIRSATGQCEEQALDILKLARNL